MLPLATQAHFASQCKGEKNEVVGWRSETEHGKDWDVCSVMLLSSVAVDFARFLEQGMLFKAES